MIRMLGKVSDKIIISCSGGPDSMAAVDFLNRGRRNISVIHFDHGTAHGALARDLVETYCIDKNIELSIYEIGGTPAKGESLEKWWRDKRYNVLHSLESEVVTGHNLNDVGEWWIFTSLRGNPKLTPYRNKNVIRPFLLTPKLCLEEWCKTHSVPFVIDPSNSGNRFARSQIRKNIIPEALKINPGFLKTMSKKVKIDYKEKTNES
jgi:tRNA(Ile)-lysidine synthase